MALPITTSGALLPLDAPLPQPPEKKMRYSREDDILLAKYFFDKPEGTSDKVFQAFGRMVNRAYVCCVRHTNNVPLVVSPPSLEGMAGASPDSQGED